MAKKNFRAAGRWVLWLWLLPGWALGQTAAPAAATGLAGAWRGVLPLPGGLMPVIGLNVAQAGAAKPTATLDLPAKGLTGVPAAVTVGARDTLVFYAAGAECRFACARSTDGQELRGVWSQPGLRVPLVLRRYAEGAAPAPAGSVVPTPAAPTYVYHTEQATVVSQPGNVRLAGTLSVPDGAGPFPAVVLLSDMGAQDRDARQGSYRLFADLAAGLARQGIAVLRLDDRGVGQSGGDGAQATTADLVRDAQAALGYLRVQPSVDAARTGLVGHGEGGNVALLAAAQPLPPAFVVTLAAAGQVGLDLLAGQPEPVASPADTAQAGARRQAEAAVRAEAARLRASGSNAAQVETYLAQQRLRAKNDQRKQAEATLKFRRAMLEIVRQTSNDDQAQAIVVNMLRQRYPALDPAAARARAVQLTSPWLRYYLNFDPRAGLAGVQCPVLLVHGTDDAAVNAAANLPVLEKGLKPTKRVAVRRLSGVNHWFQTPASELLTSPDGAVDAIMSPALLSAVRNWIVEEVEN